LVTASDIEIAATARRRRALARQREELLRKIRHKKSLLLKLEAERSRALDWLGEHLAPLWDECTRVNGEVIDAFEELLSSGSTKRARRSVRDVYRALLRRGILSPREESSDFDEPCPGEAQAPALVTHGASNAAELRARFRRVALALHPDRVQDENEKARRTEVMKDVTRAFESGDLAGLLSIEHSFTSDGGDMGSAREADLDVLLRMVSELKLQLDQLRNRVRDVQENPALGLFLDASRERPRAGRSGLDKLINSAEEQLDELERIRDVVVAFANKEITLEQFLAGPVFRFQGAEYDLDDLVQSLMDECDEPEGRGRSRKRRRH
jgi:hypothetical protein